MDRETVVLRLVGAACLAALAALGWREYPLARGLYDYTVQANEEGISYLSRAVGSPWLTRWEKALAYLARAQLYGRNHDYRRTLSDAGEAVALYPQYTAARLTRAGAEMLLRDYTAARSDLDAVIASDPNNETARQLRGNLFWQQGDVRSALADFDAAEFAEHQTPYFYFQRGNALVRMRALGGAISAYNAAIAGDPELDEALRNRGVLWLNFGNLGQAEKDFDAAIRLNPNVADWYMGRGDVFTSAGAFDRAVKDYDRALAMDPTLVFAHRNRAFANFGRARFDEAAGEFDLCARAMPADLYIALWRYIAHARAGDSDKSILRQLTPEDLRRWPGPAVSMFLGTSGPGELLNTALAAPDRLRTTEDCEATAFIGELEMIEGDKDKAQILFHRVANGCHPATLAHAAAIAEIDRANGYTQ